MPKDAIRLDKNENRFGPAPECLRLLGNITAESLAEYGRRDSELVTALGKRYGVEEERIITAYGAEELLVRIFNLLVKEGSRIALPAPSWWYYGELTKRSSAEIIEYKLLKCNDRFEYDYDALWKIAKRQSPNLLIICSPNNPTGNRFDLEKLKALLAAFPTLTAIVDEAYEGFNGGSDEALKLVERYENLIVLRSFSKFFALAGLRVGWAALADKPKERLKRFFDRYLGFSVVAEKVALKALENERFYRENARLISAERERYYSALQGKNGIQAFKSEANFVLLEFSDDYFDRFKEAIEKESIKVRFFTDPSLQNFARITIGVPQENTAILNLLQRLFAG
ncbi:MAG: histidinol-phosphate transaminase [Myxococcota bacterium]